MTPTGGILALDIGGHMGFAAADSAYCRGWRPRTLLEGPGGNDGLVWGSRKFVFEAAERGERLGRLAAWIDELIEQHRPVVLLYEFPVVLTSRQQVRTVFGAEAIVELVAARAGLEVYAEVPQRMKKHATGSGRATKPDMIDAAQRRGWNVADDHQADALWLLDLGLTKLHRRWQRDAA